MASHKSHSLNLWTDDDSSKLDIDVYSERVHVTTTGGQYVEFSPVVKIGDVVDVEQKFTDVDAAIAAGNAGSAAASALVQQNLDAYESANNATVAALSATVTQHKATQDANHASDAASRAALQTDLEAKVTAEEQARATADAAIIVDLGAETTARQNAVSSEASVRAAADTSLTNALAVERGRIDGILAGSSIDLDSLREIVSALQGSSGNILEITANLQSQLSVLTQRVDALTGSSQDPSYEVRPLAAVISELDTSSGSAWLTGRNFSTTFDFTDRYSSASSSLIGWAAVKAETIAASSGVLTNTSTDAEVKAFIESGLAAIYGSKYSGTAEAAQLDYLDPEHYIIETGLPAGSKPYFQGAAQSGLADCTWRLSYATTAGDAATIHSTVLSGTAGGTTLYPVPTFASQGVWHPVAGVGGARDGYLSSVDSLTIA